MTSREWSRASYHAEDNNCFTFVLSVLRRLNQRPFTGQAILSSCHSCLLSCHSCHIFALSPQKAQPAPLYRSDKIRPIRGQDILLKTLQYIMATIALTTDNVMIINVSDWASSKVSFCQKLILPKTVLAGKYIMLHRKLAQNNGLIVV